MTNKKVISETHAVVYKQKKCTFAANIFIYNNSCKIFKVMNVLENLKYTKDHEWIKVEGEEAHVGITDFAQHELGDIVYVDIPSEGTELGQNEVFGSIEAVKTVSDLLMPVGGEVLEFNAKIEAEPSLINTDPYGDGWIIKVKITNLSELDGLLTAEQYKQLIGI